METKGDLALLERFAVARLQHTVNELQTKVDFDRRLPTPVRKIFHCITDDSALVQSIADFKRWTGDGAISMIVPLCTLDALDDLKKGIEIENVNSRESLRYFDRCQSGAGRKPVRGVRVQAPSETFATWDECARFQDPDVIVPLQPPSPNHRRNRASISTSTSTTSASTSIPPKWIQPILNCTLHRLHPPGKELPPPNDAEETVLVTNNETVTAWAKVYGIKPVDSQELANMVERENWEFLDRKRIYEAGRGGRNGSIGSRGGGRGGRGGHRRDSSREENGTLMGFSPPSPRGNHISDPSFTLRGAPRGVARGRGKLWEP